MGNGSSFPLGLVLGGAGTRTVTTALALEEAKRAEGPGR